MSWGGPTFIILIIAISTVGWLINNWIRARHGYPVEGEWGGTHHKSDAELQRKNEALAAENERLRAASTRLEERVAVLERIATDPATRVSHEIEKLR